MAEFNYNCSINEASTHSLSEVMNRYQPSTPADRLLSLLTGAILQMQLIVWLWLRIYDRDVAFYMVSDNLEFVSKYLVRNIVVHK